MRLFSWKYNSHRDQGVILIEVLIAILIITGIAMFGFIFFQETKILNLQQQVTTLQSQVPKAPKATLGECFAGLNIAYDIYGKWSESAATKPPIGDPWLCSLAKTAMKLYNEACGDYVSTVIPDC